MKYFSASLIMAMLLFFSNVSSQDSLETVVAQSGDGIFSLLRNEGINPSKYYAEFVSLNENKIKQGSKLQVGKTYELPNAPDSFKNMGRLVMLPSQDESPIFKKEMAQLSLESEKLSNTVYYLISEQPKTLKKAESFTDNITKDLAKRLLVNGAKVYLIRSGTSLGDAEKEQMLQDYIGVINNRYLKNSGKYQRLLMVRANVLTNTKKLDVSIYHHNKSAEGERFAENIQRVFQKNSARKLTIKDSARVFEDSDNLYIAKNVLPALTLVEIGNTDLQKDKKTLSVSSDPDALAKWLTSGIFNDYAEIGFED